MKKVLNIWNTVADRMNRNNEIIANTKKGDYSGWGFMYLGCL